MFLPGLFEASLRMTGQSRLKDIRVKPEYDKGTVPSGFSLASCGKAFVRTG